MPGVVSVVVVSSDQRSTTLSQVIGFADVGTITWRFALFATATTASFPVPKETEVHKETEVPKETPLPKETEAPKEVQSRGPREVVWSRLCGQAKIGSAISAGISTSPAGGIVFAGV